MATNALPNNGVDTRQNIIKIEYPTDSFYINPDTLTLEFSSDKIALIHQTIDAILSINRYSYDIYETNNVGWLFSDLPGNDLDLVYAVAQTRIRSALSIDERIKSVGNFRYEQNGKNSITIYFTIATIFGNIDKNLEVSV